MAGEPPTRTLAKAVFSSHTTVHAALRGPKVPRWGLLELIVEQLGGNVAHFKQLWVEARDAEDPHHRMPHPSTGEVANAPNPQMGGSSPVKRTPDSTHHDPLSPVTLTPLTLPRIREALKLLEIRYLDSEDESIIAMWERHQVLFALEGPESEILVVRARPNDTISLDESDKARFVVNEWNHTRRFMKAYVGDPAESGRLSIYSEMQVPLSSGASDEQLVELIDCGAAVATSLVDWLHSEGALF